MKRRECFAAMTAAVSSVVTGAVWAQGPPGGAPGRPPGGPGGGMRPGGGMMGGMGGGMRRFGPLGMFSMPEVQKELKLTPKQIKDIEALQPAGGGMMGGMGGPGGGRPPGGPGGPGGGPGRGPGGPGGGDFEKRMREMRDKTEKDLGKILNKGQMDRFRQLAIQQAGPRALDDERVAAKLKLTPDQTKKIDAIRKAERDEIGKMFQGMGGPGGGPGGPGRPPGGPGGGPGGPGSAGRPPGGPGGGMMGGFGRMRELREKNGQKMLAVLTTPQKKQFDALKGKPFKFPERRGGFGGPGGGRPGAPGGGPSRT